MTAWRLALANQQLPQHALPWLGLTTPQIEQALLLPGAKLADLMALDHLLHNFRRYIAFHDGMWSFVHKDFSRHGNSCMAVNVIWKSQRAMAMSVQDYVIKEIRLLPPMLIHGLRKMSPAANH